MPELPEVETTVNGLQPIQSLTIKAFSIFNPNLRWPVDPEISLLLENEIALKIYRRAKYIILKFKSFHLVIHLGMTGKFTFSSPAESRKKHDHIEISFFNFNQVVRYNDPRRFGSVHLVRGKLEEFFLIKTLGVEPLSDEFSGDYLFQKARNRQQAIKAFIMNQSIVVGVGNIYASEALFMTGIPPQKKSKQVSKKLMSNLTDNIKTVLTHAIEKGGSSINDFFNTGGQAGYFQIEHQVYGREGLPCKKCGSFIKKVIIAQRSSFFCHQCQR